MIQLIGILFVIALMGVIVFFNQPTDDEEVTEDETGTNTEPGTDPVAENTAEFDGYFEEENPVFTDNEAPSLANYKPLQKREYTARIIHIFGNEFIDPKVFNGSDGALEGVATDIQNVWEYYKNLSLKTADAYFNVFGEQFGLNIWRDTTSRKTATMASLKGVVDCMVQSFATHQGLLLFKQISSGHGTQVWKRGDDADNYSEAYVCYNGCVLDDDFRAYLGTVLDDRFDVVIEADRCFSGGLAKGFISSGRKPKALRMSDAEGAPVFVFTKSKTPPKTKPRIKFLAACSENETAADLGVERGGAYLFTTYNLLKKANGNISYADLIAKTRDGCKIWQTPRLFNGDGKKTWSDEVKVE